MPVWHSVTVAFSLRRVSSSPSGRPTVTPRPTTTTSAPAIATPWRRSSSTIPYGVHGSGASWPSTSQPRFVGCRPSASLAGSMSPSTRFSSRPFGSGQLDDVAGARRVGVEAARPPPRSPPGSRSPGRSTRIDSMPTSAQSLCLPLTYQREPGVVPDEHGAEPGHDALLAELGDPRRQLVLDRRGGRRAVEFCAVMSHPVWLACFISPGFVTLGRLRAQPNRCSTIARSSPPRLDQWEKCRVPVKYIVTPAALAGLDGELVAHRAAGLDDRRRHRRR